MDLCEKKFSPPEAILSSLSSFICFYFKLFTIDRSRSLTWEDWVRQGSWNIDSARGYELLAISAAVIGGSRIQGGRLDPLPVFLAAGFVQLTHGITHLTSMPSEASYLFTGLALASVCFIDGRSSRMDANV